jgi:stearoyl-CoA desaturase (delta-9 desaturase)
MNENLVRDWLKVPELVWLDRLRYVPPLAVAAALYALGAWLGATRPELGTSGLQLLVWAFFLTTTVMYHVTFCVNSVSHVFGRRTFDTADESRNLLWLALLTNGEGWHNNHHRYPGSARQGFFWWEIDVSLYVLELLRMLGIVWDVRRPPEAVYAEARRNRELRAGASAG